MRPGSRWSAAAARRGPAGAGDGDQLFNVGLRHAGAVRNAGRRGNKAFAAESRRVATGCSRFRSAVIKPRFPADKASQPLFPPRAPTDVARRSIVRCDSTITLRHTRPGHFDRNASNPVIAVSPSKKVCRSGIRNRDSGGWITANTRCCRIRRSSAKCRQPRAGLRDAPRKSNGSLPGHAGHGGPGAIGRATIWVDCDVLQAAAGHAPPRTRAVTTPWPWRCAGAGGSQVDTEPADARRRRGERGAGGRTTVLDMCNTGTTSRAWISTRS
jgi:hypothetical protein